jgi:uncharacterized delta-60 repeat protein
MKSIASIFGGMLLGVLCMPHAHAQSPGQLDPTFGADGLSILSPVSSSSMDNAQCAVLRPTGELVFAGVSGGFSGFAMTVGQIHPDGSLDSSFGTDGITTVSSEGGSNFAYDIVVLDNGKVLIAGAVSLTAANTAMAVWRLTADGALDPSFADNGALIVDIDERQDYGEALLLGDAGQITLVGKSQHPESYSYRAALVRCDASGVLLETFGTSGLQVYPEDPEQTFDINAATSSPSGEMFLAGYTLVPGEFSQESRPIVMGFDNNGMPLPDFGEAGFVVVGEEGRYFDIAFTPNGLIAVGDGFNGNSGVVRSHDLTGALNMDFGTDGMTLVSSGPGNVLLASVIQPDGRIVVGGSTVMGFLIRDFLLARLHPDGTFDETWGDDGVMVTEVGPGFEDINDLVYQPDGRIIATGFAQFDNNDFVFARYGGGEVTVILGCTDAGACNYNPNATSDDGSCYSPGDACDDGNPETENDVYDENCDCVGEAISHVEDFDGPLHFRAYPNPTSNQLTIQRSGPAGIPCRMRLMNAAGIVLLDESVTGTEATWDLSGFARGIYLLSATSATGDWTERLILQ